MKMIKMRLWGLGLLVLLGSFRNAGIGNSGNLVIEIANVRSSAGMIWVGVYDSELNFLIQEEAIVEGFHIERPGLLRVEFPELPYGTYAIALFHDENNNGKMDRNILGIPTEPFAFSRHPPSKWRLPRFEEVNFGFTRNDQLIRTSLRKWWE